MIQPNASPKGRGVYPDERPNPVPFVGARGFTRIPNAIIRDSAVSRPARLTYVILASYAWGEKDYCFPSQETLAGHLGCSERKVRDYLSELEDAGYIYKKRVGLGKNNHYTLKPLSSGTDRNVGSDQERTVGSDKEYEVEEDKYKNPPGGAEAPPQGESMGKDQVPKTSETSTLSAESENRRHGAARELSEKLTVDLEAVGVLLDDDQRERYRINFKRLLDKDVDAGELAATVDRIVERWSNYQLSPQQALGDVRGESGGKFKPSPPEAIEAIRKHHYFGESGTMKKKAMWEVAERWDFTSEGEPPREIRKRISPDRMECDKWLRQLHSIARRAVKEAGRASREAALAKMGPFTMPRRGPEDPKGGADDGMEPDLAGAEVLGGEMP